MSLKKNDTLCVLTEDLSPEGHGVARSRGMVVFVPGALPGENWQVKLIKVTAKYAVARREKRMSRASELRVPPPCPVFGRCGGCQLQHMAYTGQLRLKEKMVADCLTRIGGEKEPKVLPALGMETPWRYRNKGLFPVAQAEAGLCCGLYAAKSHRLVPVEDCLIQSDATVAVMNEVTAWAREKGIEPYDEQAHKGVLRHVMGRSSQLGEVMAVIVTATAQLPHTKELVERLRRNVPGLASVYHNINPEKTNVALGRENRLLWGKSAIRERLGPVSFLLSPLSFFQVNTAQTVKLYDTVAEAAQVADGQTVYDAYCGVGTIGQYVTHGKRVRLFGVETVEQAVADARENALGNGPEDARYEAGAAEEVFPRWIGGGIRPDVVLVDPPRKGCDGRFLDALMRTAAPRVVYVSCNPATLARDLVSLRRGGYRLAWARPVDMFPHTTGIETVALLLREGTGE
jgi:23S rRNA (uracil1939-C5)-methyltransferase